ncbi:hypothetical protein BTS2_3745 [Bacillus sp. TS-2]|nr:hypothetical protein BTS2_3745 [Bacillus sp. TS-2]
MDILIRTAKQSDYESLLPLFRQVHELHVSVRSDLYKENSTPVEQAFFESQLIDDKQHIFVAVIGDDLVGAIVAKEETIMENSFVHARNVLYIKSLSVASNQRKKGIGKNLTEHIFDFGRSLNVDSIELGVSEENTTAIDFYKSMGMTTKSRNMEFLLK